ncbi:hypothetical protein [Pseudomonas putida]
MNNLLRHIHQHSLDGLHSGLVIGAGSGSQLADWRQLGCRQLLLAEAHPRLAEELGRRLRHEQGEQLLAFAVTAEEQPLATLQPINNLAYSSLNTATELFEHYPNLRRDEVLDVPARSLEQLLAEQALDARQLHALSIAAPGQALQLLQSTSATVLQAFTWILIECSSEALYQDDASASEITAWMEGLGYDLASENPDAIYPQSQLLFERNPSLMERQRLLNDFATLRSQAALSAEDSQQQIAQLQQQLQQRDKAVLELTEHANEQTLKIEALNKQNTELTQAFEEQAELASKAQVDTAHSEDIAALAIARDALAEEKSQLIKAYDEQVKLGSECNAQIDKITAERDQAQKTVHEQKKALETAHEHVKTLQSDSIQGQDRQRLLEEELIKAEAQLELIKDLLLREPGL